MLPDDAKYFNCNSSMTDPGLFAEMLSWWIGLSKDKFEVLLKVNSKRNIELVLISFNKLKN